MEYLVGKRDGGSAHLWMGKDTACRMASTGGLNRRRYYVSDSVEGRPVCTMCKRVVGDRDWRREVLFVLDALRTNNVDLRCSELRRVANIISIVARHPEVPSHDTPD